MLCIVDNFYAFVSSSARLVSLLGLMMRNFLLARSDENTPKTVASFELVGAHLNGRYENQHKSTSKQLAVRNTVLCKTKGGRIVQVGLQVHAHRVSRCYEDLSQNTKDLRRRNLII